MKNRTICKGLTVAVIIMFIGLAIQPSVAVQPETKISAEPKDYLFQTIIDIANNPDVKKFLENYKNDLLKVDIDRSVYRKILFENPRLFRSLIFTKPSISQEYLYKCYNNGNEITNILGEDKALDMMNSIEVTNSDLFDEFNIIIMNDGELSGRLETLKEMNEEKNSYTPFWENYPIICSIMASIIIFIIPIYWISTAINYIAYSFFSLLNISIIANIFYSFEIIKELTIFCFLFCWILFMFGALECWDLFPYW
ncbi:hypothetical protein AYK21_03405 [Thermoplasmatales archaeon SG8-52-2]|nr:MAG: hypothetical protein AYK21_03405 [Thermoplasmatales archaeon SG8-52-2]